ncbi:hypothetical protein PQR07_39305 [Paraburkholderia aspalathi]
MIRRAVRLEAAPDGRSVLLIDTDSRKPGVHRETRYEITAAELIAAIRAHGTGLHANCAPISAKSSMPVLPGTTETRPDRV